MRVAGLVLLLFCTAMSAAEPDRDGFTPLFPADGSLTGWSVRRWDDVSQPAADAVWQVQDGVLHGGEPRGTWLISDRTYSDFVLAFEWRIPERGNSGLGLRFPDRGDPAFDGIELQMVDSRYYGDAAGDIPPNELTGGLYRAVAPSRDVFRPSAWNEYLITVQGPHIVVVLNGVPIQKVNLDEETIPVRRHDGTAAVPLKQRPRAGHLGLQELSRGGGHVEIRNARIRVLDGGTR